MKRLISLAVGGRSLRHAAVSLHPDEQSPVRAIWQSRQGEADVSALLFPLSLRPLLLGLAREADQPGASGGTIVMRDSATDTELGSISVEPEDSIEYAGGSIDLLRPVGAHVRCVSLLDRAWHYALAWRQVRYSRRLPHAFQMSFADLRALNIFYMMPRPTYLVSVLTDDSGNIFPMDLVGPLGGESFLLALRRTSSSVEPMATGRRIALSGVPAQMKDQAYRLAAHHKQQSIDWGALPFPTRPSPTFGIPVPEAALRVRELEVQATEHIGSHMVFVTRVRSDSGPDAGPQLCHISDMYLRWRAAHGRPIALA